MLYREAVRGRLPGLRLAAADARTAHYLTDKVRQLEAGQPLPATLAETELRFHLYRGSVRLELLVKDYQGEHVEVGRVEPIGDFLRDCDAVWLTLDAGALGATTDLLRRQQEVEQLVEQYLAAEAKVDGAKRSLGRPVALVLTKADLLGPEAGDLHDFTGKHLDMVRHALEGQAGPFCVLANQFKRKEAVAWRIRVLDQTGAQADDKMLRAWSWSCPTARRSRQSSAAIRRAARPLITSGRCTGSFRRTIPRALSCTRWSPPIWPATPRPGSRSNGNRPSSRSLRASPR